MPDNNIPGLTPATREVFDKVSRLNCIKGLFLCGGTGQSLQMAHRLSEDLDFELLGLLKERPMLDFGAIIGEIKSVFQDAKEEILGDDHFLVFINQGKVKLSFYRPENPVKTMISCGCLRNMMFRQTISETGLKRRWRTANKPVWYAAEY